MNSFNIYFFISFLVIAGIFPNYAIAVENGYKNLNWDTPLQGIGQRLVKEKLCDNAEYVNKEAVEYLEYYSDSSDTGYILLSDSAWIKKHVQMLECRNASENMPIKLVFVDKKLMAVFLDASGFADQNAISANLKSKYPSGKMFKGKIKDKYTGNKIDGVKEREFNALIFKYVANDTTVYAFQLYASKSPWSIGFYSTSKVKYILDSINAENSENNKQQDKKVKNLF